MNLIRQNPEVQALQARLRLAREAGDDRAQVDALALLLRVELRDLTPEQREAQAQYIAAQCRRQGA